MEENKYTTSELINRIWTYAAPFKWIIALTLILNMAVAFVTAISVPMFKFVLDLIFAKEVVLIEKTGDLLNDLKGDFNNYIVDIINVPNDLESTLFNFGTLIISIYVFKGILRFLSTNVGARFQENIIKSIRDDLFNKLTNMSLSSLTKNRQGELISIMSNDINVVYQNTIQANIRVLREFFSAIIYVFILLAISSKLTVIAFAVSFSIVFLINFARRYLKRYASKMQKSMANYTSTLQETINGLKVIQAYNSEKKANEKFTDDTGDYVNYAVKHTVMMHLVPSIGEVFAIIALSVVLVIGGNMTIDNAIPPSELITFIFILFAVMRPVSSLTNTISGYQRGSIAASRVFTVMDQQSSMSSGDRRLKDFNDSIEIKNVRFSYEDDEVLKGISLNIHKGEKIAFVGASGSGKSTVLDLVVRFYDPDSGDVILDGLNIKDYNLDELRSVFGMVSQETILFNDTVKNNLLYGNPDASNDKIDSALKTSHAYNFINKLPNKDEELLGDKGMTLSGGERQRLAIARALVRDPQILIFDEATSALDSENEKQVQEAINEALEGRTAIIVAHRLATIIDCDRIYVFDEGKIVEHGSHKDLLENEGVYKKLYDIQFKG